MRKVERYSGTSFWLRMSRVNFRPMKHTLFTLQCQTNRNTQKCRTIWSETIQGKNGTNEWHNSHYATNSTRECASFISYVMHLSTNDFDSGYIVYQVLECDYFDAGHAACLCWKRTATESGYVLNVTMMMTSLLPSYDRFMATTNPMKIVSRQGSVSVSGVQHSNIFRNTHRHYSNSQILCRLT